MVTSTPFGGNDARGLLDEVRAAILVVDRQGLVAYANEATAALAGTTPDRLEGRPFHDSQWHARDRHGRQLAAHELPSGRALRGESVVGAEVVIDGADGQERVLLAHAEPLHDEHGDIGWAVATIQDVTGVVDWQEQFDASQSRLSAIFDHALEPIVLAGDDGTYLTANRAAERLLGYERDGLTGVRIRDVLDPDPEPGMTLDDFVAAGRGEQVVRLRCTDGTTVEVEARSVANIEEGVHLSVWRDVTEKNRALRELAASRAQLDAIVEGASVGLLLVRSDSHVGHCNAAARAILGTDVTGVDAAAALASVIGDLPTAVEVLEQAELVPTVDQLAETTDGRHLRLLVTPVDDGARILHLEDVTARQIADDQLRAALAREHDASMELTQLAELKDTFLSAVSHELRTPLTAIHGFATTLQNHLPALEDHQVANLLERLSVNADRLWSLLDDLLDLDRLHRGVQVVQRTDTTLMEVIEGGLMSVDLRAHHLEFDVQDVSCHLDRAKVERVVENLAMNAIRHTPAGTTIQLSAQRPDDVVLRIEDDGPGVSEDVRARVFDMFAKGESPEARAAGTGVGLALVHEFVALMDGTIELTDSPMGGAAFEVRIPVP